MAGELAPPSTSLSKSFLTSWRPAVLLSGGPFSFGKSGLRGAEFVPCAEHFLAGGGAGGSDLADGHRGAQIRALHSLKRRRAAASGCAGRESVLRGDHPQDRNHRHRHPRGSAPRMGRILRPEDLIFRKKTARRSKERRAASLSKKILTSWWTGEQAPPPLPPLPVFAKIFQISGRKNCKVTIFALENEIFRRKNRPAPTVHAAGHD